MARPGRPLRQLRIESRLALSRMVRANLALNFAWAAFKGLHRDMQNPRGWGVLLPQYLRGLV